MQSDKQVDSKDDANRTTSSAGRGALIGLTIAAWAGGLILFASTTRPFPTVELCAGILLALLAGVFSLHAGEKGAQVARYLVWVNALGGLLWAMAFAPDMFAGAWLAGVCVFGVVFSAERVLLRRMFS